MLRLSLLLSVFLLGQITLFSQSITHNGRVLDAENSSPLPGAVVQDELSGLAVTTDADGYHYHAASAELNAILGCFSGVTAKSNDNGHRRPPRGTE